MLIISQKNKMCQGVLSIVFFRVVPVEVADKSTINIHRHVRLKQSQKIQRCTQATTFCVVYKSKVRSTIKGSGGYC